MSAKLKYYIPSLQWLPKYSLTLFRCDLVAGVTCASLLVPQGLSYAQALAKLPPVQGLWTSFIPLIAYAFLGTSRQLSVGPEALVSMLVGSAISEYIDLKTPGQRHALRHSLTSHGHPETDASLDPMLIATLLSLMVGFWTFLLGIFRLGFLDSVLSRALLRGFITAVAAVIIIEQGVTLCGINVHLIPIVSDLSPLSRLVFTISNLGSSHLLTILISTFSITFLAIMRILKSRTTRNWVQSIPEIFLLVVFTTCMSWYWDWEALDVLVLKDVKGGLYIPRMPPVFSRSIKPLVISSILIAVIGFVESIVISKQYGAKYHYPVSPNRELVALGVSNIVGSVFGAWPVFGSLARSQVMDRSGAKTQFAGLVAGMVVLFVILFALPLFYFLPKAALASIILVAACGLIEVHDFVFLYKLRAWTDVGLLCTTFFVTIIVSIEVGTLISIALSLLLVIKHTTLPRLTILGRAMVVNPTGDIKSKFRPLEEEGVCKISGCVIVRLDEGLFFGNVGMLTEKLRRVEVWGELGRHPGEEPPKKPFQRESSVLVSSSVNNLLESPPLLIDNPASPESIFAPLFDPPQVNAFVFDFSNVNYIDASATQTLHELFSSYNKRHIHVCLCRLKPHVRDYLVRSGIYHDVIGRHRVCRKVRDAVQYLSDLGVVDFNDNDHNDVDRAYPDDDDDRDELHNHADRIREDSFVCTVREEEYQQCQQHEEETQTKPRPNSRNPIVDKDIINYGNGERTMSKSIGKKLLVQERWGGSASGHVRVAGDVENEQRDELHVNIDNDAEEGTKPV